jgi:hypothetical protein
MTLPLRPTLGLAAAAALCLGSAPTFGFFAWWALAWVALALVLATTACLLSDRDLHLPDILDNHPSEWVLAAVGVLLLKDGIDLAKVYYPDVEWARHALPLVQGAGIVVLVLTCAVRRLPWSVWLALALTTGTLLRLTALAASPDPVIDVYAILRDAPDHVLRGTNPYAADIQSPYGTERAERYGIGMWPEARPAAYPPLPILAALPFRAAGLDPRGANVAGDLAAALALFAAAYYRGRPRLGVLAAVVFLHWPRAPFIIEQAWYEPLLAALLGCGLCLAERPGRRRWLGHVLLGLGLTGKQFGLVMLPPLAWAERRRWWYLAAGLGVAVLVILPWFLWGPADFLDVVLYKHLGRGPVTWSLTFTSGLMNYMEWDAPPPWLRPVMWTVGGVLVVLVSLRGPQRGAAVALGMGTALCAFCLFHTQGFLNYFYLCSYLWLLGYVAGQPAAAGSAAASVTEP